MQDAVMASIFISIVFLTNYLDSKIFKQSEYSNKPQSNRSNCGSFISLHILWLCALASHSDFPLQYFDLVLELVHHKVDLHEFLLRIVVDSGLGWTTCLRAAWHWGDTGSLLQCSSRGEWTISCSGPPTTFLLFYYSHLINRTAQV